ncbi:MAG: long-chain fatty acid--CoA ligase [Candidatus Riflebacteria bacterium]|nr:long-chain fatty acid--CoA ligase [Candidatus Riflebacteria bacterium]
MVEKSWLNSYDSVVAHEISAVTEPLHSFIALSAAVYGNKTALKQGDFCLNYREFDRYTSVIAGNLRINGLERQNRVAVFLPNCAETVLSFWSIIKAGAIGVMTNPLYSENELSHQLNDSGARFVITNDLLLPRVAAVLDMTRVERVFVVKASDNDTSLPADNAKIVPWQRLTEENHGYVCTDIDPCQDIALLQYTGGTTGISRGCMLTHANLYANARQCQQVFHVLKPEQEVFVGVLPYFHIYGLTVTMILPVVLGGAMLPLPRFTPRALLNMIQNEKITCMASAPSIFSACLSQKDIDSFDLSSLKLIISGSAPLPVAQMELFENKTGAKITEGYGLSETSPVTHFNPIIKNRKAGSIGLPVPSTEARIVDVEYGVKELGIGQHGEIVIRGPQVMKGYYQQPGQTELSLRDGWLYTGDIGFRDEEGYFFVTDRKKDLIISGGYNIYPREVEEVLFKHPSVKEAVVVGARHATRGEVPRAFVVPVEGQTIDRNELIDFCRKNMANYKVPRDIKFRETLPKSSIGKILRRALRDELNQSSPSID